MLELSWSVRRNGFDLCKRGTYRYTVDREIAARNGRRSLPSHEEIKNFNAFDHEQSSVAS